MSFEIFNAEQSSAGLSSAILVYAHGGKPCYATVHAVETIDGRPVIRAGEPATREALAALAGSLVGAARSRCGMLPPTVLSAGDEHLVWWVPPGVRSLHFDSRGPLGKRNGSAPHPGLVFALTRQSWMVVAVKGQQRPESSTPTFHAPYMNVWDSGVVCAGSVRLPKGTAAERIAGTTDAFFRSFFTHPNHGKAVRGRGGLDAFWAKLLDAPATPFPERALVARDGETVGQLIDHIERAE